MTIKWHQLLAYKNLLQVIPILILATVPSDLALAKTIKSVKVHGFTVKAEFKNKTANIYLIKNKKVRSSIPIEVDLTPSIVKLYDFKANGRQYIVLDYSKGFTYGTRHETECFVVAIYKVQNNRLIPHETQDYKCNVNSSDEVYLAKGFYYPYEIDKSKAKINFIFAPPKTSN